MAYASVDDVQGRIPRQLLVITDGPPASQPSAAQVAAWCESVSVWIDNSLAWRYTTPITDEGDLTLLKQVCEALVAARIWTMIAGYGSGQTPSAAGDLRKEAYTMLAYDQKTGRSMVTLATTIYSEMREAATGQAESSFSDPDSDDGTPRLFTITMEL